MTLWCHMVSLWLTLTQSAIKNSIFIEFQSRLPASYLLKYESLELSPNPTVLLSYPMTLWKFVYHLTTNLLMLWDLEKKKSNFCQVTCSLGGRLQISLLKLKRFKPINFYYPRNHQKNYGFLMICMGIKATLFRLNFL